MRHSIKADKFFTKEERERIKNVTQHAESGTSGEIAVMVVGSSDHYIEAEIIGGILFGGILSLIITVLLFHSSVWSYIPLSFLLFFPARFMFKKIPVLKTVFIGAKRKDHAVRRRAVHSFHERGFYKTKKHTGILFFLSLFERKIWILADKGIHEKIKQETLDRFAMNVSKGIRDGRACDALCEAIADAGQLLAQHFPITPEDTNELPDGIVTE